MTAREELAQSIATYMDKMFGVHGSTPGALDYELADALLAEGWGKRRTVTTVEELDALPVGSVMLDGTADAWQVVDILNGVEKRYQTSGDGYWTSSIFLEHRAPIVILHAPEPQP